MNLKGERSTHPPAEGMRSLLNLVYFGTELILIGLNENGWWKPTPGVGKTRQRSDLLGRDPSPKVQNKKIKNKNIS